MGSPFVTAIVPVFNGERFLGPALDSILSQDYTTLEVIVVDDGSTDGSAGIVRRDTRVRHLSQSNGGVAAARNLGILAAQGEILAFLDQDDLWLPNKLTRQVEYLSQHPDLGYVLAWQRIFAEAEAIVPDPLRHLIDTDHVGYFPGTLVARRWVFDRVGLYSVIRPPAESADWFARAKDAGVPMAILPEVLLLKRLHDANQSLDVDRVRAQVLRALKASVDRQREHRNRGETPSP